MQALLDQPEVGKREKKLRITPSSGMGFAPQGKWEGA